MYDAFPYGVKDICLMYRGVCLVNVEIQQVLVTSTPVSCLKYDFVAVFILNYICILFVRWIILINRQ